jgi:RNA polymerase sigma-70 factor (ECF subfamily)
VTEERREEIEASIRTAFDAGDLTSAAQQIVRDYGPELLGFLISRTRDDAEANEVFAVFCEDLWRGLHGFAWRSTARAWAYALARHAHVRHGLAKSRHQQRNVPLSRTPELETVAQQVRTTTAVYRQTEVKNQIRALREQLPLEDQSILILRIDKELSWRVVALVMSGPDDSSSSPTPDEVEREAARMRKRFQLAKEALRVLAREAGLL